MKKDHLKTYIEKAAEAHAKETLGEKQESEFKTASKAIKDDFKTGAIWMYNFLKYNTNHG
ncbi:hypothetical protein EG339_02900 [Chryseobacterium bernardetii]|uniref:Uncharacterized protein n=1 Tax=Chryseobacterium bernardetii TaxID=1241978 RepID=A0A3G6T2D8_9FLAO|nr:hypothetical protein [Chryseobacterium bernardetii]AZB23641.1 hypothetical protein EG339_02900 [Chryseobacterium bernardetii]